MNLGISAAIILILPLVNGQCLYEKCPSTYDRNQLNVHLVCHSHCDMGWLKTVEQYYWGANQSIQNAGVEYILNTVYDELMRDPNRRFVWTEIGYFWRWWRDLDSATKESVKMLVNEGRLEFINGGWVSHDEATTHYVGMIDEMTLGHQRLNEWFGRCGRPVAGWQIDPFGHSRENANLYAMMGLDSVYFARIHWIDRNDRLKSKNMEFTWQGSDDDTKSRIFTNVFPVHYSPPYGFHFGSGDVVVDRNTSSEYNLPQKLDEFIDQVRGWAHNYTSNHMLITMGDDFQYQDANKWFINLDRIIKAVNSGTSKAGNTMRVYYSTPSCYFKAVQESNITLETKTDDLFPYADSSHVYWTGYFTSRPTSKGYVRMASNVLQVCKQFSALANLGSADQAKLDVLRKAEATLQHHDAVAGTEKQHVADDYATQISEGIAGCEQVLNDATVKLSQSRGSESFCSLLNVSVCPMVASQSKFTVRAFNGMSRTRAVKLRIPVQGGTFEVTGADGQAVDFDLKKVYPTTQLPYYTIAPYELLIPVLLPPMGYETLDVQKVSEETPLTADFDKKGKLASMTDKNSGVTAFVKQDLRYYVPSITNSATSHVSGAYIFRPKTSETTEIKENVTTRVLTGKHYQEVWQTFGSWASQVVRLEQGKPYLEIEWTVGPIPITGQYGKEVISRFDTDIRSGDLFYTDANGRQMAERRRDYQKTYTFDNAEPVAGNYFPVNTRIAIRDNTRQLTVLTDRSQGGSSLKSGSLELMVHRRLTKDDGKGVGEPLNEVGPDGKGLVARGIHRVLFSGLATAANLHRTQAEELFNQPILTFSPGTSNGKENFHGLNHDLPPNVKIITAEPWDGGTILLRLEHVFQKSEDVVLSQPVTVNLAGLFSTFNITRITETTLTGNRDVEAATEPSLTVVLRPMQIRTFRCAVSWQ